MWWSCHGDRMINYLMSTCRLRFIYIERKRTPIFTGRNEIVAKVIFLHLSVILFMGGVSASVHAGIPTLPDWTPPRADTPPREQTPSLGADTPQSRNPPGADSPPGADTPGVDTPPPEADTLPRKQTPAYGQWAAGTNPTWMHSCFLWSLPLRNVIIKVDSLWIHLEATSLFAFAPI